MNREAFKSRTVIKTREEDGKAIVDVEIHLVNTGKTISALSIEFPDKQTADSAAVDILDAIRYSLDLERLHGSQFTLEREESE